MRSWLIAILLLAVTLGGCTESPDPTDDGRDGDDGPDDGGHGGNNTAPTALLTADVRNGTAPLSVNLTLDGSDADGDNLTWTLTLAGNQTANGTTLPAVLNFTLEAGNWTFVLSVSDGNLTTAADLTIAVDAAVAEEEEDPLAPQDRGWYIYDPVTSMCHVKSYTTYGVLYVSALSGGTWVLAETNGVAGLQVEDNHPASGEGLGFELAVPDCKNGDLVVV